MSRRWQHASALLVLGLAAFALRLAYRIDYDEDIDTLRMALGVERFDVASLRPHAPFYPVYIALAKLFTLAGCSAHGALGMLGAISGAITVVTCAVLAFDLAGRRAAIAAGALAIASPFMWLASEKCSSDMTGTAFVMTALVLAVRARRTSSTALRTASLVVLGIGLGVRLSYFPFALACLVAIARDEGGLGAFWRRLRDLTFGVVLWLVPLVVVAGARPLVATTWTQAVGHFTRWGGSVVTVSSPAERVRGIVWGAWANVLGGAWPDAPGIRWIGAPILVALLVLAIRAASPSLLRRHPELVLSSLLYFAWAALGQNIVYKPRHLLPLCPLLVVALAIAAQRIRVAWALALGLAMQWMIDAEALVRAHLTPSPVASLVDFLRDSPDSRPVLTREADRLVETGAPARRVVAVRSDDDLLRAVDAEGSVFITSESLSRSLAATLDDRTSIAFSRPRSRYVDSLWNEISLLAIAPRSRPSP
jgi:hypothetical protein